VGYDTIGRLLQGNPTLSMVAGILVIKSAMWAISLGSGTSGGVLAPLLMIGAALGGLEAFVLPHEGAGFWPLISMAAVLGGTMRAPLMAVVFAVELTHDLTIVVPALLAVMVSHTFTVLTLPRSILTEKVSRRGMHVSAEYSVDPLEVLLVRSAMNTLACVLRDDMAFDALERTLRETSIAQRIFPIVDGSGRIMGVRNRRELEALKLASDDRPFQIDPPGEPVVIPSDAPLRVAAYRMAETGLKQLPVVEPGDHDSVVGVISLEDLLKARAANLDAENRRHRPLRLWHLVTMFSNRKDPAKS
jgi:CBS domain-containing protein